MARVARIVAPGFPHHITQRGNYRQEVFEDERDKRKYLSLIKEYSDRYGLKIWAYCLMYNHVHFIAVPLYSDSLSKTFRCAHARYSMYFNRKKNQTGHLWQGRFYSCCLDETHLYTAVRYVENNPVRAGLTDKAENYPWSSAASHIGGLDNPVLTGNLSLLLQIPDWREYLSETENKETISNIRACTWKGRPAGSKSLIARLEKMLDRDIGPRLVGRPAKGKK
ncbi:MAG: transposase [Candidatus Eremiobacteraeota bacterium]|nr:transposase [Candidatus Eremiobacteraeota bacterium]